MATGCDSETLLYNDDTYGVWYVNPCTMHPYSLPIFTDVDRHDTAPHPTHAALIPSSQQKEHQYLTLYTFTNV
jgi:hypothetical protein